MKVVSLEAVSSRLTMAQAALSEHHVALEEAQGGRQAAELAAERLRAQMELHVREAHDAQLQSHEVRRERDALSAELSAAQESSRTVSSHAQALQEEKAI